MVTEWQGHRPRHRTRLTLPVLLAIQLAVWAPGALAESYPDEPVDYVVPVCESGGAPAAVSIDAGTVSNATVLDLSADGGTGIGDSSGGNDNLASSGGDDTKDKKRNNDGTRNNGNGNNSDNNRDNDKNAKNRNASSEVAAAGNGGVSGAEANGGAITVENVNSGGNVGSAIAVGDTFGGYDGCGLQNAVGGVFIDGSEVTNQTIISVSADGGTAIADASGGDGNFASTGGNAGNGGSITSSAGNGGVANASANGGVISLGDINSGGNAGNAIGVGDTVAGPGPICCAPPPYKPIPVYPGKPGQAPAPGTMSPGKVVIVTALPSTGSGMEIGSGGEAVALTALAAGLASIAMRRRVVCAERVRVMG